MDTQAIETTGNQVAPSSKKQSPSSSAGSKIELTVETRELSDKVDLSSKAKALSESKKNVQASSNTEQRKFSVTDENDVILQVIDRKTQEVVKSVPSEEQIQLKNAVRDGISNIIE